MGKTTDWMPSDAYADIMEPSYDTDDDICLDCSHVQLTADGACADCRHFSLFRHIGTESPDES